MMMMGIDVKKSSFDVWNLSEILKPVYLFTVVMFIMIMCSRDIVIWYHDVLATLRSFQLYLDDEAQSPGESSWVDRCHRLLSEPLQWCHSHIDHLRRGTAPSSKNSHLYLPWSYIVHGIWYHFMHFTWSKCLTSVLSQPIIPCLNINILYIT